MGEPQEHLYPEIEDRLRPLALPLEEPEVGDWLAEHPEPGQTFRQYLSGNPVHRDRELNTIHLCLLGDFSGPQERILGLTREYLGVFFDVPVHVRRRVPLADIPTRARRTHPGWGDEQDDAGGRLVQQPRQAGPLYDVTLRSDGFDGRFADDALPCAERDPLPQD